MAEEERAAVMCNWCEKVFLTEDTATAEIQKSEHMEEMHRDKIYPPGLR